MTTPEFSRLVRVDSIGSAGRDIAIEADESERAALARRFGLLAVERVSARASLTRGGDTTIVEGRLSAAVTQSCVVTAEPVEAALDEAFTLEFRRQPEGGSRDEEVELGADELDVIFHDGTTIDIGEAVAETLALGLDPFPRGAGAQDALRRAGVTSEVEAGPFGALAALKEKPPP